MYHILFKEFYETDIPTGITLEGVNEVDVINQFRFKYPNSIFICLYRVEEKNGELLW